MAVEFMVRQKLLPLSPTYDWGPNLYVSNLWEYADNTPNLHLNVELNAPLSVSDPAQTIFGWVSYKFLFARGFPAKADSEYSISKNQNPSGSLTL